MKLKVKKTHSYPRVPLRRYFQPPVYFIATVATPAVTSKKAAVFMKFFCFYAFFFY